MANLIIAGISGIVLTCLVIAIFFIVKERRLDREHNERMNAINDEFFKKMKKILDDGTRKELAMVNESLARLAPDMFLLMIEHAPEWSILTTGDELHLYTRFSDQIQHFVGPNSYGYSHRDLSVFTMRVKYKMMKARGKMTGTDQDIVILATT